MEQRITGAGLRARLAAGLAALVLAGAALAAEPAQDERARLAAEYFRVSGYEEMYSDPDKLMALVDRQMQGMFSGMRAQMSPAQVADFDRQMTEVMPQLKRIVVKTTSGMKPDLVAALARTYTVEELRALVDFYGSPVGRAVVAKNPQLMQSMMEVSGSHMAEMIKELQTTMGDPAKAARKPAATPAKGK